MLEQVEPRVEKLNVFDPGRAAYEEFAQALRGHTMIPEWGALPRPVQIAWYKAAKGAFDHFMEMIAPLWVAPEQ